MKKLFISFSLIFLIGCATSESKRTSEESQYLSEKFIYLMKAGKTTREQEQAYILATRKMFYEQDRAIRGTKKADKTKNYANIEAETGVNPATPLKLD